MLTRLKMLLIPLVVRAIPREVRGRAPVGKGVGVRTSRDGAVTLEWLKGSHHCAVRLAPAEGGGHELLYIETGPRFVRSWRCPLDEELLRAKKILR